MTWYNYEEYSNRCNMLSCCRIPEGSNIWIIKMQLKITLKKLLIKHWLLSVQIIRLIDSIKRKIYKIKTVSNMRADLDLHCLFMNSILKNTQKLLYLVSNILNNRQIDYLGIIKKFQLVHPHKKCEIATVWIMIHLIISISGDLFGNVS